MREVTHPFRRAGTFGCLLLLLCTGCADDAEPGSDTDPVSGEREPNAGEPEPTAEPEAPTEPEPTAEPEAPTEPEPTAEPEAPTEPEPAADAAPPEPSAAPDSGEPAPEPLDGVCGQRGEGMVTVDSFVGFEERYIIGDEGFGDDVCVVRFPVERVGDTPDGCVDLDDAPCVWTHQVELGAGEIVTDEGGACASSDLALGEAAIAALEGTRMSYGFVDEYVGHNSVLLVYDEGSASWIPSGNATWDDESGSFRFDRRDGICSYTPMP